MTQPIMESVREAAKLICDALERRMGPQPEIETWRKWIAQQDAQLPTNHLTAWCEDALEVIARGVELMPLEQLGQWTGVRHVQEMYDAAQRGEYLADAQPQPASGQENDDPRAPWKPQPIEGRERVKLGVIEFHSARNPQLIKDFYVVTDDCRDASVIVDVWLMDIATVLRKHGYEMAIFRPQKQDATQPATAQEDNNV